MSGKNHNPESQDPHEDLANYPELLHHGIIRAYISDSRRLDYWKPVHLDVERDGVKP